MGSILSSGKKSRKLSVRRMRKNILIMIPESILTVVETLKNYKQSYSSFVHLEDFHNLWVWEDELLFMFFSLTNSKQI